MTTELFNDNCMNIVPNLPAKSIVVTDPPFNIGYHYKTYKDRMKETEYLDFLAEILGGGTENRVWLSTIPNRSTSCQCEWV